MAEPVSHIIPVRFEEATHSLNVLRDPVTVRAGDTLVWTFFGAPAGYVPWIQFRPAPDVGGPFGPMASLHQTEAAVWGTCGTELTPATFSYRAVLQKGHVRAWENDGSSIWSRMSTVAILPAAAGEEKAFTISPDTTDGAQKQLLVSPQILELKGADTVVWNFENLPPGTPGWLPRVTFFRYEGQGQVPHTQLGPFTSLITDSQSVRGTGNTDVQGLYFFEVALVSLATGEATWVNSEDPVVDNRGTVTTPDGG